LKLLARESTMLTWYKELNMVDKLPWYKELNMAVKNLWEKIERLYLE